MGGMAAAVLPVAGSIFGSVIGGNQQKSAISGASAIQAQQSQASIQELRRQFNAMQKNLRPYMNIGVAGARGMQSFANAGVPALAGQQDLIGLNGADAQSAAISALEQSPQMQALMQQGENAILQNASATGGLRGGNTQGALAQFRPQVLSDLINQQYSRLGGMASMGANTQQNLAALGQASAAGVGNAGLNTANNIGTQLGNIGSSVAGSILGQQKVDNQTMQSVGKALGSLGSLF